MNIPAQQPRTQRPDLCRASTRISGTGRGAQSGGVRAPAAGAFATWRATPGGPGLLAGRPGGEQGLRFGSRPLAAGSPGRLQSHNRLNYAQPAVVLPAGRQVDVHGGQRGATFGQLLSPLNRTVGSHGPAGTDLDPLRILSAGRTQSTSAGLFRDGGEAGNQAHATSSSVSGRPIQHEDRVADLSRPVGSDG